MNIIVGFFSDIPTPYHAMDKIKCIKQNDEPMPQFNQKYRTYIEHLERKAVNEMMSHTQMEPLHERHKSSHSQGFENKHSLWIQICHYFSR